MLQPALRVGPRRWRADRISLMNKKIVQQRNKISGETEPMVHPGSVLQHRAELAEKLVERWGMVAGAPDGEDSAGRAKLRLLTPIEVVQRACETAELAYKDFERRRWLLRVPFVPSPKVSPHRRRS